MFHLSCVFLLMTLSRFGAERGGQKVDGMWYCSFARSFETGKYYAARVVFENNHANVRLASGKKLELSLDEETIEDPEEVGAADQWFMVVPFCRWARRAGKLLGTVGFKEITYSGNVATTLDAMNCAVDRGR